MAALSVADRTKVLKGLMRWWSRNGTVIPGILKTDLYNPTSNTGAIADTDNWIDTHAGNTSQDTVGFNGALSNPVKANMPASEKTLMFIAVDCMRYNQALLETIFGDVTS